MEAAQGNQLDRLAGIFDVFVRCGFNQRSKVTAILRPPIVISCKEFHCNQVCRLRNRRDEPRQDLNLLGSFGNFRLDAAAGKKEVDHNVGGSICGCTETNRRQPPDRVLLYRCQEPVLLGK